jgi:hypothetical protein
LFIVLQQQHLYVYFSRRKCEFLSSFTEKQSTLCKNTERIIRVF